jgi:hypothetical protein
LIADSIRTAANLKPKSNCSDDSPKFKRKAFGSSISSIGKTLGFFGQGPGFESRERLFLFLKFALGFLSKFEIQRSYVTKVSKLNPRATARLKLLSENLMAGSTRPVANLI